MSTEKFDRTNELMGQNLEEMRALNTNFESAADRLTALENVSEKFTELTEIFARRDEDFNQFIKTGTYASAQLISLLGTIRPEDFEAYRSRFDEMVASFGSFNQWLSEHKEVWEGVPALLKQYSDAGGALVRLAKFVDTLGLDHQNNTLDNLVGAASGFERLSGAAKLWNDDMIAKVNKALDTVALYGDKAHQKEFEQVASNLSVISGFISKFESTTGEAASTGNIKDVLAKLKGLDAISSQMDTLIKTLKQLRTPITGTPLWDPKLDPSRTTN